MGFIGIIVSGIIVTIAYVTISDTSSLITNYITIIGNTISTMIINYITSAITITNTPSLGRSVFRYPHFTPFPSTLNKPT